MNDEYAKQILMELEILRKLRIAELMDKGYSQAQLARILDVSQPTISRMLAKDKGKKSDPKDE